jgi:hypothetical protein
MSDCTKIQGDLAAYAEKLLPDDAMRAMEQHIHSCPECRKALSEFETVGRLVKGLKEVEPPPGFAFRVMSEIREREAARKSLLERLFRPFSVKIPIHAVATLLIVVAALYVYRTTEPERALQPLAAVEVEAPATEAKPEKKEIARTPAPPAVRGAEEQAKQKAEAAPRTGGGGAGGPVKEEKKSDRVATEAARARRDESQSPALHVEEGVPGAAAPVDSFERAGKAREEKPSPAQARDQSSRLKGKAAAPGLDATFGQVAAAPDLTVEVRDLVSAAGQIEGIAKSLAGRIVRRDSGQGREVFVIEADPKRIEELLSRASALGEGKDRTPAGPTGKERAVVTIQLVNRGISH